MGTYRTTRAAGLLFGSGMVYNSILYAFVLPNLFSDTEGLAWPYHMLYVKGFFYFPVGYFWILGRLEKPKPRVVQRDDWLLLIVIGLISSLTYSLLFPELLLILIPFLILLAGIVLLLFQLKPKSKQPAQVIDEWYEHMIIGLLAFCCGWIIIPVIMQNVKSEFMLALGVVAFVWEGFCLAELVKGGPISTLVLRNWCGGRAIDFGFFKYVAATAVCTTHNVFGLRSVYTWLVLVFCLVLVSLHNVIPRSAYYDGDDDDDQVGHHSP